MSILSGLSEQCGHVLSLLHLQEIVMFLFNRSGLGVCLAILVAALPVLIQYLS
jgi:hypothetical protein